MSKKPTKMKSSSEVELDVMIEAKKAPAPKKELEVGMLSKCGMWQVKSIAKNCDFEPSTANKAGRGVATKSLEEAKLFVGV